MKSIHEQVAAIAAATARGRLLFAARSGGPMEEQGDQLRALLDLAAALDAHDISFALIGGIAVGIHSGEPRATLDIDIAVPTATARSQVATALQDAGFAAGGAFEHSLNFRHQNGEPIQVAFDTAFDEAIGRAERSTSAAQRFEWCARTTSSP